MGDFNAKLEIKNKVVQQNQSRNGKNMQMMLDETNTKVKSLEATLGHWTRVKRKDTTEKSVIDYIIMTEKIAETTDYLEIDETGTYRLKGKAETDHNTMIAEIDLAYSTKIITERIYNTKNKRKWQDFQTELAKQYQNKEPNTYEEFEGLIKSTMEKTLDKITIKKGQYKPKMTEKAKQLKSEKKLARKLFEKAPPEQKRKTLDEYVKKQKELRAELQLMEEQMVAAKIKKLADEGGIKSDLFWKIRKRILNKCKMDDDYDTVTEEGKVLLDKEVAKEYIANYYENLYLARQGNDEYKQWTN